MAELSKTARASMGAGIGEKKADPFSTNDLKIAELRKQRAAKLAIARFDFIDALIEEYDKSVGQSNAATLIAADELAKLKDKLADANSRIEELSKVPTVPFPDTVHPQFIDGVEIPKE